MVLVDTSVWIRALAGKNPYAQGLARLLDRDEVTGHQLIYGELLIGDIGGRGRLLDDYDRMHQARLVPHRDVVAFVRARALNGRGVGWIDAQLLASAMADRLMLWTADRYFAIAAEKLGVAYAPAGP
jgi:predicted nucleic acid-binding protein